MHRVFFEMLLILLLKSKEYLAVHKVNIYDGYRMKLLKLL